MLNSQCVIRQVSAVYRSSPKISADDDMVTLTMHVQNEMKNLLSNFNRFFY